MGRVGVITIGPDAAGLDGTAHAVGDIAIACPDAGAQTVQRVVGQRQRFGFVLEGRHGQYRAENLFLKDAHLVVTLEERRLDVIAAGQIGADGGGLAAAQHLRAFLAAQCQVRGNLGQLFLRGLGTDHGLRVERVALFDGGDAFEAAGHEPVIDRFLNQRARRTGADFTLIEGKQHQAFNGLVEITVIRIRDVGKENVGRLAAKLQRGRDQVAGCGLRDQAACGGRTGEGNLGNALAGGQRHAGFASVPIDDVEHTSRQDVGNQLGQQQDGDRCGFCWLEHYAVAGAEGGRQFPGGHQDGEVPGNDLADHAQGFVEVIRHGITVKVGQSPFLGAHTSREITEVIDRQRNVSVQGFADGFAVVDGFGISQQFQIGFDAVGDLEQGVGTGGRRRLAPGIGGGVGGVERQFDVFGGGACRLGVDRTVDRCDDIKVLTLDRRLPLATNEVVVAGFVLDFGAGGAWGCIDHECLPVSEWWQGNLCSPRALHCKSGASKAGPGLIPSGRLQLNDYAGLCFIALASTGPLQGLCVVRCPRPTTDTCPKLRHLNRSVAAKVCIRGRLS